MSGDALKACSKDRFPVLDVYIGAVDIGATPILDALCSKDTVGKRPAFALGND